METIKTKKSQGIVKKDKKLFLVLFFTHRPTKLLISSIQLTEFIVNKIFIWISWKPMMAKRPLPPLYKLPPNQTVWT